MQIDNQIRAGSTQSVRGSQLQTAKKAKARLAQICSFIPSYFDWKVQRSCWSKGTLLECAELIYVKTTEADRVCEELCQLIRICWRNREFRRFSYRAFTFAYFKDRVVVLEYT